MEGMLLQHPKKDLWCGTEARRATVWIWATPRAPAPTLWIQLQYKYLCLRYGEAYGCGYGRLRLGSIVRLRGSHGTIKMRCGHMVQLRDYGTPTEGSRLRRDYGWVLLRLRLCRNYGGLPRRSCDKEEA